MNQRTAQQELAEILRELVERIKAAEPLYWESVVGPFADRIQTLGTIAVPDKMPVFAITDERGAGAEGLERKVSYIWVDPAFDRPTAERKIATYVCTNPHERHLKWMPKSDTYVSAQRRAIGDLESWLRWLERPVTTGDIAKKFRPYEACLRHHDPEIQQAAAFLNQRGKNSEKNSGKSKALKELLDGSRPDQTSIEACKVMLDQMSAYERRLKKGDT